MSHTLEFQAPRSSAAVAEHQQDLTNASACIQMRSSAFDGDRLSGAIEPAFPGYTTSDYAPCCQGDKGHCCSCCGRGHDVTPLRLSLAA
jgi:hypothetical protein